MVIDISVTNALNNGRPARVLAQSMQHVVKKSDAGVDGNLLAAGVLGGVLTSGFSLGEERLLQLNGPAVQTQSDLDLGLIGVSDDSGLTCDC